MKPNATMLHHHYGDIIKLLSNEECGKLLKAIMEYDINGTEPEFDDRSLTLIFMQIKISLDSNREHYEKTCQKRAASAKKRWQKDTDEEKEMQMQANADNIKDKEKANVNENEKEKENEKENVNENVCVKEKEKTAASEKTDEAVGEKISEHTNTLKTPYGEFFNVYLTAEEHTRLKQKLPDADMRIDSLSAYMKASGKIYADHYAQLLNWKLYENISPAEKKAQKLKPPGERREPTFDVSEFTKKALDIRYVPPKEE